MRKAPASVVVLSILGLVLGGLTVLAFALSLLTSFLPAGRQTPMKEALNHDTVYIAFHAVSIFVSLALGLLLIGGCIGSLRLRRWARPSLIVYAYAAGIRAVVSCSFTLFYARPLMMAAIPASGSSLYLADVNISIVSAVCGMILGIAFSACILYFYGRPHVRDAFNGIFPVSPTSFPVVYPEAR